MPEAIVFGPTHDLLGRFELPGAAELPARFQAFVESHPSLPVNSYVVMGNLTWTVVGVNPLQLRQGAPAPAGGESGGGGGGGRDVVVGALWCLGGIIVTAVSYGGASSGSGGGHYVVAWGAILFGAIQLIKGLANLGGR